MKKLLFLLMLLLPVFLFAQTGDESTVPVIGNMGSFAAVVSLVLLITGWLKTMLKWQGNYAKYLSWVVAIVLSFLGMLLNIGIFEPLVWWQTVLYGFAIGLAANGAFKIETIQQVLVFLLAQIKKK